MTYRGHMSKGVVVLDEPVNLPEGAAVRVEAAAPAGTTVWDRLAELAGTAEGLPADAARNHDHYLYGVSKRGCGCGHHRR